MDGLSRDEYKTPFNDPETRRQQEEIYGVTIMDRSRGEKPPEWVRKTNQPLAAAARTGVPASARGS
ncbi:MAG: hypothetical protein M2R45_00318 [Verrucomicrobia subdivision 3 bacterium]|nr:hypothetical protein [Limisphaerales bacterium]MCS1412923.1 hypothetical protein [Limisphaerales bacterium]